MCFGAYFCLLTEGLRFIYLDFGAGACDESILEMCNDMHLMDARIALTRTRPENAFPVPRLGIRPVTSSKSGVGQRFGIGFGAVHILCMHGCYVEGERTIECSGR